MDCPVCAEVGIEPDHPDYPDPVLGDDYHGQFDPAHPEEVDAAMARWEAENREEAWPSEQQVIDWNEHNAMVDGADGGDY